MLPFGGYFLFIWGGGVDLLPYVATKLVEFLTSPNHSIYNIYWWRVFENLNYWKANLKPFLDIYQSISKFGKNHRSVWIQETCRQQPRARLRLCDGYANTYSLLVTLITHTTTFYNSQATITTTTQKTIWC